MGKDLALPIRPKVDRIFPTEHQCSNNEAAATLFSIGRDGTDAWTMTEEGERRFFGRTCQVTVKIAVFTSGTCASFDPKSPKGPSIARPAKYLHAVPPAHRAREFQPRGNFTSMAFSPGNWHSPRPPPYIPLEGYAS
jgi:hypothetical protein